MGEPYESIGDHGAETSEIDDENEIENASETAVQRRRRLRSVESSRYRVMVTKIAKEA